ncbi:MAG: glycosylase [Bacteroidetes bacterium]|nr:glycosylase [Bacteroidota bacterium]
MLLKKSIIRLGLFVLLCNCLAIFSTAQTLTNAEMEKVYQEVKTPFKYGLVLVPENDSKKLDCPSVYRKGNSWYMQYIVFDGRGYETWLSKSADLLHWQTLGKTLSFTADTSAWDANQKAGYIALQNETWGGNYQLQKFNQQYWMSYLGGKVTGYESGLLSIGISSTKKDPSIAHEWQTLNKPVLTSKDANVRWWENNKEYKSSIIWDKQKTTGYPFVMYYNANGDTSNNTNKKTRWFERIGMAVSNDMLHWKRFEQDPVMHHRVGITGDAVVQKMGNIWVMFYYGAFWENRKDAFNRFACSTDLVHWTDWNGDDLINSSEPYDEKYAHKSFVVKWKGIVYHFYCAVNNKDQRGIAVATSLDKGKSSTNFFKK